MEIYIVLYISIVVLGFYSDREIVRLKNKTIISPNKMLFLFIFLLFLLAALRVGIGTDYHLYKGIYLAKAEERLELGWAYEMLSDMLRLFKLDYQLLIAINAFVFLSAVYFFVRKFSYYKYISLIAFFGTYSYLTSYNTFRQMTSIAIVLIALILFNTYKKQLIGVVVFIFSIGLHKSSIMFAPLFLLSYVKLSKTLYSTIMIACLVSFFFIPEAVKDSLFSFVLNTNDFFSEKYTGSIYVEGEERGIANKVFYLFYWIITIALVLKGDERQINHRWIEQSFLFYFIVNSFLPYSSIVNRMSMFFELLIIVLIPKFIFIQSNEHVKNTLKVAIIAIFFVRLLYVLFLNGGEVVPYKSIFD